MIIDVNVSLGNWPFQQFPVNTPSQLARHLRREGIGEAWVSAIDSVLYADPDVHDELLFRKLRPYRMLHFVKTVNPAVGNWRESLGRWTKTRRLRAVKIFPNYHRYALDDPCSIALAEQLQAQRRVLFIQMRLDDERNQNPLMRVPGVPSGQIVALAERFPKLTIVVLCALLGEAVELTRAGRNCCVDLSFLETPDTLKATIGPIKPGQILFGSHTPFLTTRSAGLKLEMANIPKRAASMIASGNAARLLRG